jgi:hypothetical protein
MKLVQQTLEETLDETLDLRWLVIFLNVVGF